MEITSLSLRDPAGELFDCDGRLLRLVRSAALTHLEATLNSAAVARFVAEQNFIPTWSVKDRAGLPSNHEHWVEHPRIPFASYPHEWSALQLFDAAQLTLDIAESLLDEGLGLKDASPYNVLFSGSKPIFIDVLSVERRAPGDSLWLAYAQFVRTFLNPLAANKYLGQSTKKIFLADREGLSPEELLTYCGPIRWFFPPFLSLATIPKLLSGVKLSPPKPVEPEKAKYVLRSLFRSLRQRLNSLRPEENRSSRWSSYTQELPSYSERGWEEKNRFVKDVISNLSPKSTLDIGCNTGHFSEMAATAGSRVVSIDVDAAAVDHTYLRAKKNALDLLALQIDVAFPSPGLGWRNREALSFIDRANGQFDLVLCLAVVHHLLLTSGIPLKEVLHLVSQFTTQAMILEWIEPSDPLFKSLARGRDFNYLTREYFEEAADAHFTIVKSVPLYGGTRFIYELRKK